MEVKHMFKFFHMFKLFLLGPCQPRHHVSSRESMNFDDVRPFSIFLLSLLRENTHKAKEKAPSWVRFW